MTEILNGSIFNQHFNNDTLALFNVLIDLFCRNSGNPGGNFVSPCSAADVDTIDQAVWPVEGFKGFESLSIALLRPFRKLGLDGRQTAAAFDQKIDLSAARSASEPERYGSPLRCEVFDNRHHHVGFPECPGER